MTPEQIAALVGGILVVLGGGGYGVHAVRNRHPASAPADGPETTDVLLQRIGELETALAAERARSEALEAQVQKLTAERRELSSRVAHLEGQVQTLSNLVTKLIERGA